MKIKAGKYTFALTMVICGILMLISSLYGRDILPQDLWRYSPIVLIIFGLEIIILNTVYEKREGYRVGVSLGSLMLIVLVIIIFIAWTNKIEIHSPLLDNFF